MISKGIEATAGQGSGLHREQWSGSHSSPRLGRDAGSHWEVLAQGKAPSLLDGAALWGILVCSAAWEQGSAPLAEGFLSRSPAKPLEPAHLPWHQREG